MQIFVNRLLYYRHLKSEYENIIVKRGKKFFVTEKSPGTAKVTAYGNKGTVLGSWTIKAA